MSDRETYYKCTVCGRVGSVGRCCGTDTRHPLNDAARAESIGSLDLVARIRQAIGDDGKRMQGDLIEHCRQIAAAADLLARVRARSETRGPYGDGVTNARFLVVESTDAGILVELAGRLRRPSTNLDK